MTLLLLASDDLKDELFAFPIDKKIQLKWITAPGDLVTGQSFDTCIDLLFENTAERVSWLKKVNAPLTIINSVIVKQSEIKHPFIRVNGWNTFLKRPVVEAATIDNSLQPMATQFFSLLGRTVEWTPDIAGFISARVVASIINEAFFALEEKVSTAAEIDTAMKLGTNYPFGPFEWGKKIGLHNIYSLLAALSVEKNRYTPSLLLKQTALA